MKKRGFLWIWKFTLLLAMAAGLAGCGDEGELVSPPLKVNDIDPLPLTPSKTLTGTTEPGAEVEIIPTNSAKGEVVTATAEGEWSVTVSELPLNSTFATVTASDKRGNSRSQAVEIYYNVLTLDQVASSTSSGVQEIRGLVDPALTSATLTIAEPTGEGTDDIVVKKVEMDELTRVGDQWSYILDLPPGNYNLNFAAARPGITQEFPQAIVIRDDAPILTLDPVDLVQTAPSSPTLSGTAAPEATISLTLDGAATSFGADAEGQWSYPLPELPIGRRVIGVSTAATVDGETVTAFTSLVLTVRPSGT